MGKYDDEVRELSTKRDSVGKQARALFAIANELSEINKFLDKIGLDEKKFNKLLRAWLED